VHLKFNILLLFKMSLLLYNGVKALQWICIFRAGIGYPGLLVSTLWAASWCPYWQIINSHGSLGVWNLAHLMITYLELWGGRINPFLSLPLCVSWQILASCLLTLFDKKGSWVGSWKFWFRICCFQTSPGTGVVEVIHFVDANFPWLLWKSGF
jgi:hypothetical protein